MIVKVSWFQPRWLTSTLLYVSSRGNTIKVVCLSHLYLLHVLVAARVLYRVINSVLLKLVSNGNKVILNKLTFNYIKLKIIIDTDRHKLSTERVRTF